jgi:2-polyprenyl-3-methyl-5-hydroxy-6-metoxy-1,4-benzoquinol methylase
MKASETNIYGPWQCPTCGTCLGDAETLSCPSCGRTAKIEGRLVNFKPLTPSMHIGLNKIIEETHDAIADNYPDESATWRVQKALEGIESIQNGGSVLEVGGAIGSMTVGLEKMFDRVYSIEHSEIFIRCAIERTCKAIHVLGDATHIPLSDGSTNLVVCTDVLEHVVVPSQLLLEIRRALSPDGLAYVMVPNNWRLDPFRVKRINPLAIDGTHVNFYDTRSIQKLLTRCGFEICSIRTISPHPRVPLTVLVRRPWSIWKLLPVAGKEIECIARPVQGKIKYWENIKAQYSKSG